MGLILASKDCSFNKNGQEIFKLSFELRSPIVLMVLFEVTTVINLQAPNEDKAIIPM